MIQILTTDYGALISKDCGTNFIQHISFTNISTNYDTNFNHKLWYALFLMTFRDPIYFYRNEQK